MTEALTELIIGLILIIVALVIRKAVPWLLKKRNNDRRVFSWIEGAISPMMYLLIVCAICMMVSALVTIFPDGYSARINKIIGELPDTINKIIRIAAVVFIGWAVISANKRSCFCLPQKSDESEESRLALIRFASALLTVVVVAFMVIIVITELGFNVTALVTGLGLGGLTVALAAKDAAANFFGGAVIVTERPFEIGDFIRTDAIEGTVTDINMRATTVRNLSGSYTVVPNSTLSNSAITNLTRGVKRKRIEAELGFEYGSAPNDIEEFMLSVKQMFEADKDVDPKNIVVRFVEIGTYSLKVKMYCYTKCTEEVKYLAVKERLFFAILDLAKQHNLSFALPVQMIPYTSDKK